MNEKDYVHNADFILSVASDSQLPAVSGVSLFPYNGDHLYFLADHDLWVWMMHHFRTLLRLGDIICSPSAMFPGQITFKLCLRRFEVP